MDRSMEPSKVRLCSYPSEPYHSGWGTDSNCHLQYQQAKVPLVIVKGDGLILLEVQ